MAPDALRPTARAPGIVRAPPRYWYICDMSLFIDLNRRFVERPKYEPDELIATDITGKQLDWPQVLEARFAVVVAPANSGKTTEMRHRAGVLRGRSEAAVFLALRRVAVRGTLEKALEPDELDAFRVWKERPSDKLTLFVDSLDEAAAVATEGIEDLVRDVASEVGWPNASVRWVIATRPAVLAATVLEKLTRILVTPTATRAAPTLSALVEGGAERATIIESTSEGEGGSENERLRLYSMLPLDPRQAASYLNGAHATVAAAELLRVAAERGLAGFTASPGGLDILARIDLLSSPPESLTEVFQRVVNAVQQLYAADPRRETDGASDMDAVVRAAERLASASLVCRLPSIELPEDKLALPEKALSARLIATPTLTERALARLLNSQLFIDVGSYQVKVYPDELVPFLAARRLAGLVQSPEQAHRLVQNFAWTAATGEQGIYRQYLPLMGWLATLNSHCRQEILEREPQALAFFGDLRHHEVPLDAAVTALTQSIRRLVEQGDRLGRGYFTLTSENFWQAGPVRLRTTLAALFDEYGHHHWAREALLDIAAASRCDVLRTRVLRHNGNRYDRLITNSLEVRYLLEVGVEKDLHGIAAAVKASTSASERRTASLVAKLGWKYFTPRELVQMVDHAFARDDGGHHFDYVLGSGGLPGSASDQQLYELSRALVIRAARLREARRRVARPRARTYERYIGLAVEVLAALAGRRVVDKQERTALLCLILHGVMAEGYTWETPASELRNSLDANTPLRRTFLRLLTQRAGQTEQTLWMATLGMDSLCTVTEEDVEALNAPLLTRAYRQVIEERTPRQETPEVTRPSTVDRLKLGKQAKKQLNDMLAQLRDGTAGNALAWVATWLLQTSPTSRYGEISFEAFESQAGPELAEAVRQGLSQYWRKQPPMFEQDTPRTTYHSTIAGLQGLSLELGEGKSIPELTDDEVRRALRYGAFEINGYPKWFWPLADSYPPVAADELAKMADEASLGAVANEHAEYLLTSIAAGPEAVRRRLAPLAWKFLTTGKPSSTYVVERLLDTVMEAPASVSRTEFEREARSRMKAAFKSSEATETETHAHGKQTAAQALEAQRAAAVQWGASWFVSYPNSFQRAVNNWGPRAPAAVKLFLFRLAAHFGDERGARLSRLAQRGNDGVAALETFYDWSMWAVNPDEDIKRPEGIVYSPGPRDSAQQLRDMLITAIASAKSQYAYDALGRMRAGATGPREMYLRKVQFEMREAEAERSPLQQVRYGHFEQHFSLDVNSFTAFAMAVHNDLLAVRYDIEHGEHSLRRFFSEVTFKGAVKRRPTARETSGKESRADRASLALEADFQTLLASELKHHANGRYSVTVESQTAESKRRDVLCSKGEWHASIELKMSMHWSLNAHIEALEKQLVGQYMRHRHANAGFLVVVLQDKVHRWRNPPAAGLLGFDDVLELLNKRARELEAKSPGRFLRVIGIDATTPEDFRAMRQKTPGGQGIKRAARKRGNRRAVSRGRNAGA